MEFPINVYLIATVSALLASAGSLPIWRILCQRVGWVDDPGHRKIHATPTPLAGGLAVMTGLVLPLIGACVALWFMDGGARVPNEVVEARTHLLPFALERSLPLQYGLSQRAWQLLGIIGGAALVLVVGLLDDRFDLKPAVKFSGQFIAALLAAWAGVRITIFVPSLLFSYGVTVLWILFVVNAFNFIDNMNGLCSGLGAIAAWWFALYAAKSGQYLVALMAFLGFGALLGFLPYNFPRARAFLGDSGSHLVGFLLAVLAVLPHFHTAREPKPFAVLIPFLFLAIPLGDLVWVVLLRWRAGKPFYVGDTNHISHRLVARGLSRERAVLWLWLAAAMLGAVAFWF